MAVAVESERDTPPTHHSPQEQEVPLRVFLLSEESVRNVAAGIINRSHKSEPGPTWTQPLVAAAIDL